MKLKEDDLFLLRDVVRRRGVEDEYILQKGSAEGFVRCEIDQVCGWINDEFLQYGLDEDFEPNEYGIRLEKLLDVINRTRGDPK